MCACVIILLCDTEKKSHDISPDVNECETSTDICGGGDNMCTNIDDGGFYECNCADGFVSNEMAASNLLLTCVGMYVCMNTTA